MDSALRVLEAQLAGRLPGAAREWLAKSAGEVRAAAPGEGGRHLGELLALAARQVSPRVLLAPSAAERAAAEQALAGWNVERWGVCDALRAVLVLSRADLGTAAGAVLVEGLFGAADEGEQVALYRTLPLLSEPQRFAWRMGEGCRSNMRTVFEAAACDTPYACTWFDAPAWKALVIKAVFVGAPLWRVWGLDRRLDADIATVALDLVDERRAAGRPVAPELWLCLGAFGGQRGTAAALAELAQPHALARLGAGLALARAGARLELERHLASESEPRVRALLEAARTSPPEAGVWRAFEAELRPAR